MEKREIQELLTMEWTGMKMGAAMATSKEDITTQMADCYEFLMDANRSEPKARKQLLKAFADEPILRSMAAGMESDIITIADQTRYQISILG